MSVRTFFVHGGRAAWGLVALLAALLVGSSVLLLDAMEVRYERDVTRMVFNDNLDLLERVRREVGATGDSLARVAAAGTPAAIGEQPYIVVSIEDRRLWYKHGDSTLFTTQVAVGSGKELVREGGNVHYKFDTPRGRLVVQRKDSAPAWIPPDWHYLEQARKRGLGLVKLTRGRPLPAGDGAVVTVVGNEVVKRYPDGRQVALEASDGREIVVNGNIVVPPFGTNQRKYEGVLGSFRLYLGDGYGLHGTDNPASIGQAVSHGCVRLRNEDIETLYRIVPLGTPVYIY